MYDVIVVGGGASGMMAAGRAAERGNRVLLLEKNEQLGQKLRITGGGRCNITNAEEDVHRLLAHYGNAQSFLYTSLAQFGVADTVSFFASRGLPIVVQENLRAFPATEKAGDVVRVLEEYLAAGNVDIATNTPVTDVVMKAGAIAKVVAKGEVYQAASYIFATGGMSHPETGSSGDGFSWLAKIGHTVAAPTPTIVPLRVVEPWITSLAGVSLPDVKITFYVNDQKRSSLSGTILCTHFGLSGPLILNAAASVADMLQEGVVTARIDTAPTLDLGALDKKMVEIFDANKNRTLKNVLKHITPPGTANAILGLVPYINPATKAHSVSREDRKQLGQLLKTLPVTITGLMGFEKAVVADGGVVLSEIDGKTFRSRVISNLFVTGDLLHINRPSGGYSLQLCWTTGYVAGNHA